MRVLLRAAVLLVAVAVAGCSASTSPSAPAATPTVTVSSAGGGCGSTTIETGGLPDWTADAAVPQLPHVVAHEGNLVGVLFVQPLVAPARTGGGPNNKILWISRVPRAGADLRLTLTPTAGPVVTLTESAGSSPGEIYPSIVDVAGPGCWSVVAEWGSNRATLELAFQPA